MNDRIDTSGPPVNPERKRRRRGHETEYGGIKFRSRHEATWAAFFDEIKLQWDYEPEELDGYIPDFRLKFALRPLLIEIKPNYEEVPEAQSKIVCSGWDGDIAILIDGTDKFVGMFREEIWDRAVLAWCLVCTKPTIAHESGRWECRHCGAGNRSIWWAYDAHDAWRAAKNKVQWRPKK